MPKISDDFVMDRFFELFAKMPQHQREGVIRGLRATSRVMQHAPKQAVMNHQEQLLIAAELAEEGEDSQDD